MCFPETREQRCSFHKIDFDQADGGPVESPARADLPCGWTRFEMAVSGRSDARRLDVCPACLDKVTLKVLATQARLGEGGGVMGRRPATPHSAARPGRRERPPAAGRAGDASSARGALIAVRRSRRLPLRGTRRRRDIGRRLRDGSRRLVVVQGPRLAGTTRTLAQAAQADLAGHHVLVSSTTRGSPWRRWWLRAADGRTARARCCGSTISLLLNSGSSTGRCSTTCPPSCGSWPRPPPDPPAATSPTPTDRRGTWAGPSPCTSRGLRKIRYRILR